MSGSADDDKLPEVVEGELVGEGGADAADPLAALGGGSGGLDLGAMMEMAQDMTSKMGEAQSQLAEARVEGSAGGELVKVTLNGHLHLVGLSIDPAAFDPDDPTILEDLVLAAWKDAHDDVAELQAQSDPLGGLGGLGGGLGDLLGGG
ncbi:MAG: YbaB/EbfC family nucleoid-associated protein [Actinomycetia bacterium]|nr:YbaB/EbfC family nucleoid-associated protein [Actinomycetes bacterium]